MVLLEELEIKNFRGFDALKIEGLSKINLFVGKNNSGKTSILEALFLLTGTSNPALLNYIDNMRGLNTYSSAHFKYLFHKLTFESKPFLNGVFSDTSEREVEFGLIFKSRLTNARLPAVAVTTQPQSGNMFSSVPSIPEAVGLGLNFTERKSSAETFSWQNNVYYSANNGINFEPVNSYNETLFATYIYPTRNDSDTLRRYTEIVKRDESDDILDMLKMFDENIINVQPLPDGIYVKLKDAAELVPINVMGDGVKRCFEIITAAINKSSTFVLIDEIENGLHYSAYRHLLKWLISYSQKYDKQLFITTHNIETLESLNSVLGEDQYQEMRDFSRVFSISKTARSEYKAYRFSYDEFNTAIENSLELRD